MYVNVENQFVQLLHLNICKVSHCRYIFDANYMYLSLSVVYWWTYCFQVYNGSYGIWNSIY